MAKKNRKKEFTGQVVIPLGHPSPPEPHEVDAALILARHYKTTVEFIVPVDDYRRKTADINMLGVQWEIKSPTGKSRYTIQEQFKRASHQAKRIIIDSRRTKLTDESIEKSIRFEQAKRPAIQRVIFINKSEKVIEIQR